MKRVSRIATLVVAAAVLCPVAALGQFNSAVVGFNTNPNVETSREMFRIPEVSGSSTGHIVPNSPGLYDHNNSFRASGFQTEGAGAMNIFFDWSEPNDPAGWARVTTISGAERPNPSLHLQGKVRFKITNVGDFSNGAVGICLGIRETGVNVPMLADGGTTGDIEWVGVTGVLDPNGNPSPIPALVLAPSPVAHSVEFNLATGDVKLDGVSQGGGIAGFTGDGVLSAPNDRGTLEHIAFINQTGDPGVRISAYIDELQFESPVADPVLPPTVLGPIIKDDTTVTVTDIDPAADQVQLLRDGGVILTESPDPNATIVFTLPAPAQTGESYTATQRIGGVTSAESAPQVVLAEPSPYGFSFVLDEDGDDCGFNPPGGWEFVGASSLTGLAGGLLYPEGTNLFIDNSQWQTLDFDLSAPTVPWLGGNGTIDPSPNGTYSIDSMWWNVNLGSGLGPHEFFLDAVQVLDANDAVIGTIHYFEDGVAYMTNARGQSTVGASSSNLSSLASFDGSSSHRVTWSYPDDNQEALGLYHNIGLSCGTSPTFTDQAAKIRFHVLVRTPLDPNGLAVPTVVGPIVGAQSDVQITNDPNATAVQLYINGQAVDPNAGGVIDPMGASHVDFSGLSLSLGDSVSAKQTIGGNESDFAYPRGVAIPVAPTIETPVAPGSTSVTVSGVLDQTYATASLVTVNVNDGAEIATAVPSGNTVVVSLMNALVTGDTLTATQTVNGSESLPSDEVTVAFSAPIIYAAPAEGDTSVHVQNLETSATQVTVRLSPGGDPNATPVDFSAVLSSQTEADVTVSGLVAGDTLVAFQTVGSENSVDSDPETVTTNTTTTIVCDDFEDSMAYDTDWATSASPRPELSSDRNATIGGSLSILNPATIGRVEQNIPNTVPTATDPVVWNVAIYDTAGPGVAASNQFAQLNGQVADFFYMHVGLSGPTLQPFLDTNYYQFRANSNGGPDWINLDQLDAPMRTVGWHVFTVVHKGDFIDVYVDGLLSAKNVGLTATTTLDRARIGPGLGSAIPAYYDDYCAEIGPVHFNQVAAQPPGSPSIAAPIQDGDTTVTVTNVDADVTQVDIIDSTMAVIGTAGAPDPNTGMVTVSLSRSLVHLESITADATNSVGTASSDPLEVGNGNGDLLISIGIRETGDTGAIGSPGTNSGSIEWVGVTGVLSGAPQGQPVSPSGSWQTLTFDPTDPNTIAGFTGNGAIDGTRGTLEHLAVAVNAASPDRSSGQYIMYIDNVVNVGAGAGGSDAVIADFDSFTVGDEVLFQEPTNSGSTAGDLTPLPSSSEVSADEGNPTQSELLTWFFKDTTEQRWARITTAAVNNTPQPIIDLTKPIQMDVLLVPACTLQADISGDGAVNITDLGLMLADFGCTPPPACASDITGDGATNISDLGILLGEFGESCP